MRKEVVMTLFNENTGGEATAIGSVSIKRGKVRIHFQKGNINLRLYWDQDETERWLFGADAETDERGIDNG